MILDRIFPFARNDNDVLNAGNRAFFHDVLNLRLIDDGKHFLGLCFGRGQKSRA